MPVLTACTAVSALGVGAGAHRAALLAGASGLRPNDFAPEVGGWIGRVAAIESHRLPPSLGRFEGRNARLADMALRADGFAGQVEAAMRRHGPDRVALVLGTSTSGIASAEDAYRRRDRAGALPADFDYDATQDVFSLAALLRAALGVRGPAFVVSAACASTARALADAAQLLQAGVADAVLVGGADSLCRMTLHGFAALELIAPGPTRPCAADRDGISIGEAAAFALMEREGEGLRLLGAGSSSDGHHMSAPHPEGAGAAAAMRAALKAAGLTPAAIDYVNLHGTGTRANDAMEDAALAAVFGTGMACSSTKGLTGHTLGASGVLELVLLREAMAAGVAPGCAGLAPADPAFSGRVLVGNERRTLRRVMSNAFGFGGVNCSLVLGLD